MAQNISVLRTINDLRAFVKEQRNVQKRIALIPTMGALHDGHISLVEKGFEHADIVIATIFVNPAQFGPQEDFSAYPRTWDADLEKLAAAGAQAVFYPAAEEIYPPGFATTVHVAGITDTLEGECRPGHFDGVATVVTKLLLQALPDFALFGEKDWQQLQLIRRLSIDLDIPVEIIGVPTLRDSNGLALSSRNAYLTTQQYEIAVTLNKILFDAAAKIKAGTVPAEVENWAQKQTLAAGFDSADYIAIRDAQTLGPPGAGPLRILAAVRLGRARLIDNVPVL